MALSSVFLSTHRLGPVQAAPKRSFKEIFQEKRTNPESALGLSTKKLLDTMIDNHEQATQAVRTSMLRTDYTPEKLLNLQYKTGILFLREQMFSKTAELSARTLKNFIQMQV